MSAPHSLAEVCKSRSLGTGALEGGILLTMQRLSQGGADRVAVLLANGFADAGIPTAIAVLRDGGNGEAALLDLLHPAVGLSYAGRALPGRRLNLMRGVPFLRGSIAALRPSVVLASGNNVALVTAMAARSNRHGGARCALKVTNPVLRPKDKSAIQKLYRLRLYDFIFRRCDRILALSAAERQTIMRHYPQHSAKTLVAPNAYIRPEMWSDAPAPGKGRIVALARMMPQKRLDLLLEAFARVSHPERHLTILGDGPEKARLAGQASALGIADRVEMPGFVADVTPWLRGANLFVLSSDYEGLPAAVIEALAGNLPVVSTDCFDAVHELLGGADNCAIVPRGDPEALARAIDRSLSADRPPTGLQERARPYAVDDAVAAHIAALAPLMGGIDMSRDAQ